MKKLALIIWSIVPKKIDQTRVINGKPFYKIKLVWFGKIIIVSFKDK